MKKLLKIVLLLCAVSGSAKISAMSRAEIDTLLNPKRSEEIYHLLNPEFQLQVQNFTEQTSIALQEQAQQILQLRSELEQECETTQMYQSEYYNFTEIK